MRENDFLDIILPTKNRWHLLDKTLESLAKQSNMNFNLLVVDNSDTPEQTALATSILDKYRHKFYIKYHQTGGLNMLDNWNIGYSLSNANYCYMITDKIILAEQAIAWFSQGVKLLPECNVFLFSTEGETHWTELASSQLFQKILDKMEHLYNACMGSELKPFLKREFKNFLIKKYGKLIHFVGGDVDVVYLSLMNSPHYGSYRGNLIQRNPNVGSVGRSGEYGGNIYLQYIKEQNLDYNNLYPEAPLNIPNNFNGMYHDLFATAKMCNYPISVHQINKVNYIIDLYISLMRFSRYYSQSNDRYFLLLHNYIEENNLQFHPEINRCFRYYAEHWTLADYRIQAFKKRSKYRRFKNWLKLFFSTTK